MRFSKNNSASFRLDDVKLDGFSIQADKTLPNTNNTINRQVYDQYGYQTDVLDLFTFGEPVSIQGCYPSRDFDFSGASLITINHAWYSYGYFEIRCKFPKNLDGRDAQQNFWLVGMYNQSDWRETNSGTPIDNYSELDVFEHDEMDGGIRNANHYSTNTHMGGFYSACPLGNNYNPEVCFNLSEEFHTYGIFWQLDKVTFYFDGYPLQDPNGPNGIHSITEGCNPSVASQSISDLKMMFVSIDHAIRGWADNGFLLQLNESYDWDVDYFRYYKKKPDIDGPHALCPGNTTTYTASMFGVNTTSDEYTWSITGAGTILSSTNNTVTVQANNSNSAFDLTLIATENGPGYDHRIAPQTWVQYNYQLPRVSTRTISINTSISSSLPLLLGSIQTQGFPNTCYKQVITDEIAGAQEYWFSEDGSNYVQGNRNSYMDFYGTPHYYWSYGVFPPGYFTIYVKVLTVCNIWTLPLAFSLGYNDPSLYCAGGEVQRIGKFTANGDDEFSYNYLNVYPTASTGNTTIECSISSNVVINLIVYDNYGRCVKTLISNTMLPSGQYLYSLDTSDMPGGMYYCTLLTNESVLNKKFIVKK